MPAAPPPPPPTLRGPTAGRISSVLVANRGEIAIRVFRTLRARGIRSIAVHTPQDADARHVRGADASLEVASYLDAGSLVTAAKEAGAAALHPGYGFLSEDAAFARAVEAAGIVWIGPPPAAIEAMGDKIRAKETVGRAGVPVVPGAGEPGMSDTELAAAALAVGLPVLLKPSAGGGGKGMRRVTTAAGLEEAIAAARREAQGAFGDPTLLVERWIPRPRHVEVQVFADAHGHVVHLGERECSLQRRHQKLVEESPSPLLDEATRRAMTQSALDVARAVGYRSAGTVEFIVSASRPDEYFFMEMNTRLQVEHPVTEALTGVDLVDWQLRVAAGEPLPLAQEEISWSGHAVEARVYAEDPAEGFLPTGGRVALVDEPVGRAGVRVDSSLAAGIEVSSRYDPMLAKVIAWGPTRSEALDRLRGALVATTVLGVTTNVAYLTRLLAHPDVVAGDLDTELVGRTAGALALDDPGSAREAAIVAAWRLVDDLAGPGPATDPWAVRDGWRIGGPGAWTLRLRRGGRPRGATVVVQVRGRLGGAPGAPGAVSVDGQPPVGVAIRTPADPVAPPGTVDLTVDLTVDGLTTRWRTVVAGTDVWVGRAGHAWRFAPEQAGAGATASGRAVGGPVTSPMPGVVVAVRVGEGEEVEAGQVLVVVEAMKMEHAVAASRAGTVKALHARPGQAVGMDEALVTLT